MDKQYSDDDGFFTDEEDEEWNAPITAAWGVPSSEQASEEHENDGSGDVNGWHKLVDPNAKLRADGVGAGNLHRQGKNFKPVDEQLIVNQRLGKPIPKKAIAKSVAVPKRATKVSIQPVAGNKPSHPVSAPGLGKRSAKKARQAALATAAERARAAEKAAASQRAPSKDEDPNVQSLWSTGASLVTTPFWEQSSSMASVHARQSQAQQQQNQPKLNSKPSVPPVKTTKPEPASTSTEASLTAQKFGMQIKGLTESMKKLEVARAAATSQSKAAPSNKLNKAQEQPKKKPMAVTSKPSKPKQPTQLSPAKAPAKAPAPVPTTSSKEIGSAHSKWANPGAVSAPVLFTLNIELEKGETMPITVRANDDPKQLALAFVERYQKRGENVSSVNNDNVVEALTHLIQQQIKIKTAKS
ncbi:hypothetical protein BGW37DRAFT_60402 [Umbelopsis sp. PMI_123]|nr:hypothetical protein BGW37DRAFT_60402 [Umbelopsis sp. PMI_123]